MPNPTCTICLSAALVTQRDLHLQMCQSCADLHGVVPLPRSRRSPIPCRGCNSLRFIRAVPRELTQRRESQHVAPMGVTYAYMAAVRRTFGSTEPAALDARLSFGMLEMYICKECGLVDWFCFDPEQIPIGPSYMTEEIDYTSQSGPYR
jgi:hypothetical protein